MQIFLFSHVSNYFFYPARCIRILGYGFCLYFIIYSYFGSHFLRAEVFELRLNHYFFWFNNADFQDYDKESFEKNQVLPTEDTDDTLYIFYGDLNLRLAKQYKKTNLHIELSRAGYWGADNLQGKDDGKNSITFRHLYFVYTPSSFSFTLGRHKYEIGNSYYDYFFSDVIDGFVFSYQMFNGISLSWMADLLSNSASDDEAGYYGIVAKKSDKAQQLDDFRGDTLSARSGIHIDWPFVNNRGTDYNTKLQQNKKIKSRIKSKGKTRPNKKGSITKNQAPIFSRLGLSIFSYYLRYGANHNGGSDLAENGLNSYNKADGDDLSLYGSRFYTSLWKDILRLDFTYAYAKGHDLQYESTHNYDGYASAVNIVWKMKGIALNDNFTNIVWLSGGYFHHNFAGMHGRSMGLLLLSGYKAYSVAPYADFYHFRDYGKREDVKQYVDRTNSKKFWRLEEKIQWGNLGTRLSYLHLWETQTNELMGSEIEWEWNYQIDNLKFINTYAAFMPTAYYKRRSVENPFFSQGNDTFYAIHFRVEYTFDIIEAWRSE